MSRLLIPAIILAVFATGASAQDGRYGPPPGAPPGPAQGPDDNTHFGWADVLRVDPVYGVARVETPRQECYDQPVVRQESSGNSTAVTILGAVVGGVLGNTIGKGDGRKAATVAGAVAGGAVGNAATRGPDGSYTSTQTTCRDARTVSTQRPIMSYDVEY